MSLPIDPLELEALMASLTTEERDEILRLVSAMPPTFAQFCEQTLNVKLDPWQVMLCNRLEQLLWQKDQRLLIHAPPRHGKSVLVSQRLPAYLLGCDPTYTCILSSYNQTHSIEFSKVVLAILKSREFHTIFPAEGCRLASPSPQHQWSTQARRQMLDAQPSFSAIGMDSGFVGKGCRLLITDDPYSSASEAFSTIANQNIRTWWNGTVAPRLIGNGTNVVVMFHRFNDRDFAGMLLEEGGWEYMRFPALSDLDDVHPDALGRTEIDVPLSPRFTVQDYSKLREGDPLTWWGQFQGLPRPASGGYFQAEWFQDTEDDSPYLDELPRPRAAAVNPWEEPNTPIAGSQFTWVRAWDIAAGAKKRNDHNVGALMTMAADGTLILADIVRWKAEWAETQERILEQATLDNAHFGGNVYTVVEKKGLGEIACKVLAASPVFSRYPFKALDPPAREDKMLRANAWQAKLASRQFKMVRPRGSANHWTGPFIAECLNFHGLPNGRDDQVDAVSLAVQFLSAHGGGELEYAQPIIANSPKFYQRLEQQLRIDGGDSDATYNPWL